MNWYKLSQTQTNMPWWEPQATESWADILQYMTVEDIIKDDMIKDENTLVQVLKLAGSRYMKFDFPDASPIYVVNGSYVVELDGFNIKDAIQWIYDLDEYDIESYIKPVDNVDIPDFVYHATSEENYEKIISSGYLKVMDESRGLSNAGTGDAIFASESSELDIYGDYIIKINLAGFLKDYPYVRISREQPLELVELKNSLANMLGVNYQFEEDSSDGLSGDTVIIYSNIPIKYLELENRGQ